MQTNRISKKYLVFILFPLALFYWGLIYWRNLFYNFGFFVTRSLPCPVISIGNISIGGTGKTPMVEYVSRYLQSKGMYVGIISRGYGRKTTGSVIVTDGITKPTSWEDVGDEPFMLANKLQDIPVVVDENRYRGGQFICNEYKPDVILMDDAFQHRRVFRDVDIVLINSNHRRPKLLPYGLLREPLRNIKRADAVIFTKANLTPPDETLVNSVSKYCSFTMESDLMPSTQVIGLDGSTKTVSDFNGPVVAVSGVGDPDSFEVIMEEAGLDYVHHFRHDDHADYSTMDLEVIREVFLAAEAQAIITTEKDLAKLEDLKDLPVYALPVGVSLNTDNENQLISLVC